MLRAALALVLTLAAAANAAQSLGEPRELVPAPELVLVPLDVQPELTALCAELEAAAKNSRHGVSAKTDGGTGARVPSSPEGICEIFVVDGRLVVAGTKAQFLSHDPIGYADSYSLYAFAGFDPINNWDPFGLSNKCLAGDLVCSKKKPEVWKLHIWRAQEGTLEPFPQTFSNPKLQYQKDIATVGATTGTEATMGAAGAAGGVGLLNHLGRSFKWIGGIFRPKPPVITLPGSVPVPRPPEAPPPPAPTPRPPPAPTPPQKPPTPAAPERSPHAQQRAQEGRPVPQAFNDVQRARAADVFVQTEQGRIVVRGSGGREHIFEPSGEQVTSVTRSQQGHLGRLRSGDIRPATEDEFSAFVGKFK